MKPYVYILAAVSAALIVLQSCNNTPASAVEGDYIPEAQSVQINGVIINLADWPGCSVSIRSIDGDNAEVTLDSLLLGFDTLTVKCSVTSQGRDKYAFSGDFEDNDRDMISAEDDGKLLERWRRDSGRARLRTAVLGGLCWRFRAAPWFFVHGL